MTAHREAEEALRDSEALLAATEAISSVGGCVHYPDTRADRWTDEVYRIHGLPIGSPPRLLVAQRLDWMEARGFLRRVDPKPDPHGSREPKGEQDRRRSHDRSPAGKV